MNIGSREPCKQAAIRCHGALGELKEAMVAFEEFKPAHKDSLISSAQWMNLRLSVEIKFKASDKAIDELISAIDKELNEEKP